MIASKTLAAHSCGRILPVDFIWDDFAPWVVQLTVHQSGRVSGRVPVVWDISVEDLIGAVVYSIPMNRGGDVMMRATDHGHFLLDVCLEKNAKRVVVHRMLFDLEQLREYVEAIQGAWTEPTAGFADALPDLVIPALNSARRTTR